MFLNCWVWILVVIGTGEQVHLQKLVDQSAGIAVGAAESDVLRVLGEPKFRWEARRGWERLIFGERPAQWIYGTTIDLDSIFVPELPFLNPIPINIRLFSSEENDLIISWTADKVVKKVTRPNLNVSEELIQLYQPMDNIAGLVRLLAKKK